MLRLFLFRHAKATPHVGGGDRERPLNQRGIGDARRIGAALASTGLRIDLALVSDARRTRETFTLAFEQPPGFRFEPRVYFSQHVVHVKYFDALISGRLVINGAFDSVKEINKNEELSLTFKPSDVADLHAKLVYCHDHYEELCSKYAGVKEYVAQHLTYNAYVKNLRFNTTPSSN